MNCDVLIVGAGFSGMVMAERISSNTDLSVLVIDKRHHIGGNAFDAYDEYGVLVHEYGPHYFRTNSKQIVDYLSSFTRWHEAEYRILSSIDGELWPFPINLNTFEKLIGRTSSQEEMESTLEEWRERIEHPRNSEEVIISQVGRRLYEMFFENYTLKQWQTHPRNLDASVCGRIPVRTNRDDRYLSEEYQIMPMSGYHTIFNNMVKKCPRLSIMLGVDFREVREQIGHRYLVYTGCVDEYFDYCYGRLPYRSLEFERQSFSAHELRRVRGRNGDEGFYQPVVQINYPGNEEYTRVVEIKHVTQQRCTNTTIVREYPKSVGEPYYPIPAPETRALYRKYEDRAARETAVSFIGRLARYRYYNMDQVVGMALHEFDRLREGGVFRRLAEGGGSAAR